MGSHQNGSSFCNGKRWGGGGKWNCQESKIGKRGGWIERRFLGKGGRFMKSEQGRIVLAGVVGPIIVSKLAFLTPSESPLSAPSFFLSRAKWRNSRDWPLAQDKRGSGAQITPQGQETIFDKNWKLFTAQRPRWRYCSVTCCRGMGEEEYIKMKMWGGGETGVARGFTC